MLRQQVDDRLCRDERDAGGQDRQQPEDRAPVSQQEQHDDHRQGREQQLVSMPLKIFSSSAALAAGPVT